MKANEMPEKLYIIQQNGLISYCRNNDDDIEYTRTDAFIEKVRGWLKDCATFTDMNGKTRMDEERYKAAVEDFEKYMKGE